MTKTPLLPTVAVALFAALTACSQTPVASSSATPSQAARTTEAPKEYQVTGEVLKLDPKAQTASLKAGKIEGWMEAMTMDFPIKDKQAFEKLKVGEKIQAKVMVQGTDYWLEGVTEAPAGAGGAPPATK